MNARETFAERVAALRFATSDPTMLTALAEGLGQNERNEAARLLRNGLYVSGFAMLESFVRDRAAELLDHMSACGIAFTELPAKLQTLATKEATRALAFQVDLRARNGLETTKFVKTVAAKLATSGDAEFELSPLAFGSSRSNITADDIATLLKAFVIFDGWGHAGALANRMGLGQLDLKETFENIRKRRNEAAHRADAEVPLQDLAAMPAQTTAIAATVDALLTRATFVQVARKPAKKAPDPVQAGDIRLRFLTYRDGVYRDERENGARAARVGADRESILAGCRTRASKVGAAIVEVEHNSTIGWEVTDLSHRIPPGN